MCVENMFKTQGQVTLFLQPGWPANFDFHFPGIFQVFPADFSSIFQVVARGSGEYQNTFACEERS